MHERKQEESGNTAHHDDICSAEMIACAEDTGENGCHECVMNIGTTTDNVINTMANAPCFELKDLLCYAFVGREACIDNAVLMAYASECTSVHYIMLFFRCYLWLPWGALFGRFI